MKDGLYNIATEWSTDVIRTVKKCRDMPYTVQPTHHFKEKCVALGLSCSVACVALKGRIIEAEIKSGCVVKLVTRIKHRYKENTDMVFAVALDAENQIATVKTVWVNHSDDNHSTLRLENLS